MPHEARLGKILTDRGLAQFGDALINFACSLALTEKTGQPKGTRVPDRTLADAAVKADLRSRLPRRIGRGEVANSLEALLGFVWLEKLLTMDEILTCLRADSMSSTENFVKLARLALSRLEA